MPQYVDYDGASLYIDPIGLSQSAKRLIAHAKEVAETITAINHTLSALALSWAGKTQEEAEKMNGAWTATMRGLFGTEDVPQSGVLNVMAAGTEAVAMVNGQTELAIADMFVKFLGEIQKPSSGTPSDKPPEDHTTIDNSAIIAHW
ncbi:hypothetical protein [Streptomyces sp. NBC_01483]|uniref:hypothetical protein n=1 Tax=Streptomyces sp. NBC_01483 TaxID=2903883 RepID=UPI002E33BE3F|nr:hypothetical protein [Streptomyces sp. NBC_01483]